MEKNSDRIIWSAFVIGLGVLLATIFLGIRYINPSDGTSLLSLGFVQKIANSSFDVIHDYQGTLSSNLMTASSLKDLPTWSQDKVPVQYDSDTQATLTSVHGGFLIDKSVLDMSQLKPGDLVKLSVSARGRGKLQLNYGDDSNTKRLDSTMYYDGFGTEYNVTNDWKTYRRYYKVGSTNYLDFVVFSSGTNAGIQTKDIQIQRVDE